MREVVLEMIDLRVAALFHAPHQGVDFALIRLERLQLPAAVVNDPDRGGETQRARLPITHHGIDVHVKLGVLGVGHKVVEADLQVLEAGG